MTTLVEAREAIYGHFLGNYTGLPAAQITADNEAFDAPEDLAWGRLAVREFVGRQESLGGLGNRKFLRTGSVFFQIFTPADQGTEEADTLAQEARELLEGVKLDAKQIWLTNATVREIGPDGAWYNVVVEASYQYTETR